MSDLETNGPLAPLSNLARKAAADAGAEGQARPQPSWEAFVSARAADDRLRRRRGLLAGGAGVIALVAVAGFGGGVLSGGRWIGGGGAPLTFTLDGAAASREGYIPRVQEARALVSFSDGTVVTLQRGARAWVASTDARGGRIRLEEGQGHFAVQHRAQARWAVDAGPYTIDVTGTEFDVSWAGADDRFEVHLIKGAITVRGPLAGDGVKLRPGQRFRGTVSEGAVGIEPTPGERGAVEREGAMAPAPATAPSPSPPTAPAVAADSPPGGDEPRPVRRSRPALAMREAGARTGEAGGGVSGAAVGADWRRLVARGQFHVVIREAEDFGIDNGVARLASDRLMALADAARYTARPELAQRVLGAQRQRFPGTAAASDAAFLLGRLAEDTGAPLPRALGWYERYLTEAPKGSYAAEALGRKMLALTRLSGAAGSRAVAREYVERYPNGQYVTQARGILESGR